MLADCNLTPEAIEWVFTIADEIPVFIDTVSEFKAEKIRTWYSRIHTLKPTQKELEILWGKAVRSDADRVQAVNDLHQQGVQRIFVCLEDEAVFCSEKNGERFYSPRRLTPVWTASARMMASWPGCSTAFWRK